MKTRDRQTKSGRPTAGPQPTSSPTKPPSPQSLLGQRLPDYELKDATGNDVRLHDFYKTGRMVLYFYPRDMTPGCTREACAFRDGLEELKKLNAVVVGVSADNPESHARFSAKYKLNFPLLTD